MNPAEERERLDAVKAALDILAEGEPITLAQAAPNSGQQVREVLRKIFNKLAEHNIVERSAASGIAQPTRFRVIHGPALDALRQSDADIADLIWPGQAAIHPSELPAPEPEVPPTPEATPLTMEEKVDRMTALFVNAMQSLIYIREKVDAMEAKVNRLYSDLTGEKG